MSVPVGQRSENKLEVYQRTKKLIRYSLEIMQNKKKFPEFADPICSIILQTEWNIASKIWQANNVYIGRNATDNSKIRRRCLQNESVELCESLIFQIDLIGTVLHRPANKTFYWSNQCIQIAEMLRKWRDSDAQRLKLQDEECLKESRDQVTMASLAMSGSGLRIGTPTTRTTSAK